MLLLTNIVPSQDWFFILILISFFLIALIKGVYWKHAKLFFMGVLAQRYANQYLREENGLTEMVSLLTFSLMIINFTMIILKLQETVNLWAAALVFLLVCSFFLLKQAFINLLGLLFKVKDLAKIAVFFSFLFDKTLAFVLSPLLVMMYFFIVDISPFLILVSLGLFIIALILKLFWLWKIGVYSFGLSQSYIFLYLCSLEIFPLLLLGKGVFY